MQLKPYPKVSKKINIRIIKNDMILSLSCCTF